jgi:hypothetical protein
LTPVIRLFPFCVFFSTGEAEETKADPPPESLGITRAAQVHALLKPPASSTRFPISGSRCPRARPNSLQPILVVVPRPSIPNKYSHDRYRWRRKEKEGKEKRRCEDQEIEEPRIRPQPSSQTPIQSSLSLPDPSNTARCHLTLATRLAQHPSNTLRTAPLSTSAPHARYLVFRDPLRLCIVLSRKLQLEGSCNGWSRWWSSSAEPHQVPQGL